MDVLLIRDEHMQIRVNMIHIYWKLIDGRHRPFLLIKHISPNADLPQILGHSDDLFRLLRHYHIYNAV